MQIRFDHGVRRSPLGPFLIMLLIVFPWILHGGPVGEPIGEPVGYWPLDGNTNNLCSSVDRIHSPNRPHFVGSYAALGLELPCTGILARLPSTRRDGYDAGTFSIEGWIRWEPDASGSCFIYTDGFLGLGIKNKKPVIICHKKEWLPGQFGLESGQWYFLAATFDGNLQKLYINGKERASAVQPGSLVRGSQITIGGSSDRFRGILDEVKIFDTALSAQTVLEHFNAVPRVVAVWSFDNDTTDKSGFEHHGKIINGARFEKGRINNCLYFDGNNDYALFSNKKQLLDPGMNISIEAWICGYSIKADWQHIYDKYRSIAFSVKDGRLAMGGRGGWWFPKNTVLKTRQWYHVVGTYSLKERKIYINGKLMNSQAIVEAAKYGDAVYISSPYFPFHGLIDEVKLYTDTLSAADVLKRYNAQQF